MEKGFFVEDKVFEIGFSVIFFVKNLFLNFV